MEQADLPITPLLELQDSAPRHAPCLIMAWFSKQDALPLQAFCFISLPFNRQDSNPPQAPDLMTPVFPAQAPMPPQASDASFPAIALCAGHMESTAAILTTLKNNPIRRFVFIVSFLSFNRPSWAPVYM